VNRETGEVSFTGLFYFLSHFSKYVRPGMKRIEVTRKLKDDNVKVVAFKGD